MRAYAFTALIAALATFAAIQFGEARHWKKQYDNQVTGRAADRAQFEKASALALANDVARAAVARVQFDAIAKEKDSELIRGLAVLRRNAADYGTGGLRLASTPLEGGPDPARLPSTSGPAGQPNAVAADAVVPRADLDACAINTAVAQGWQRWWVAVRDAQGGVTSLPPGDGAQPTTDDARKTPQL